LNKHLNFDETKLKQALKLFTKIKKIDIINEGESWGKAMKEAKNRGGRLPEFDKNNKKVNELSAIFALKQLLKVMNINIPQLENIESEYYYWSSTAYSTPVARVLTMSNGNSDLYGKHGDNYVVCIYE
jgi:hypothetical protein